MWANVVLIGMRLASNHKYNLCMLQKPLTLFGVKLLVFDACEFIAVKRLGIVDSLLVPPTTNTI